MLSDSATTRPPPQRSAGSSLSLLPRLLSREIRNPGAERGADETGRAFDPAGASLTLTIAASDYVQVAVLLDFTLRLRREAPGIRIGIRAIDGAAVGVQM